MIGWSNEKIDAFLASVEFCEHGNNLMTQLGNYGLSLDEAAQRLWDNGYKEEPAWVRSLKNTENYVRFNGETFDLTDFKVTHPFTNEEFIYATEEEVKLKMLEIAKEITSHYNFAVSESHLDEAGDETWTAIDMVSSVVIS